jgi:hypothetical protein
MFCGWNLIFFRFSGWNVQKRRKFFDSGEKKQNIEKKLPDAKRTFNDSSGGFSIQKRRLDCDTRHESEQRRERWYNMH